MRVRPVLLVMSVLLLGASFPGCSATGDERPIVVGSKIDTEGALLAHTILLLLEDAGYPVEDKSYFGTTEIVRKALLSGELDIYPEYTGSGMLFFPETDPAVWQNAALGYDTVRKLDLEANGIVWLQPAPANNTWAIAVPESLADAEGLVTLDDLAAYLNKGGYFKIACSEEFVTSPAALPAFQAAYGFELRQEQLLTLAGGNTAQTEQAAAQGIDGVNAAMAYGTDGALSALGLIVLTDPRGAQPVYEPAPTVRSAVLDSYPGIADVLNPAFKSMTLEVLQELNGRIAFGGEDARAVARDYLTSRGFL